jgi:hypothetical protein
MKDKMRQFIDIVENRDPIFGIGLWVSPTGEIIPVDGDHTEFMSSHSEIANIPGDPGLNAIQAGWTRVVIKATIWLSAKDLEIIRNTLKVLYRRKWATPDIPVTLDLIDGDDSHSFRVDRGRDLLEIKP